MRFSYLAKLFSCLSLLAIYLDSTIYFFSHLQNKWDTCNIQCLFAEYGKSKLVTCNIFPLIIQSVYLSHKISASLRTDWLIDLASYINWNAIIETILQALQSGGKINKWWSLFPAHCQIYIMSTKELVSAHVIVSCHLLTFLVWNLSSNTRKSSPLRRVIEGEKKRERERERERGKLVLTKSLLVQG